MLRTCAGSIFTVTNIVLLSNRYCLQNFGIIAIRKIMMTNFDYFYSNIFIITFINRINSDFINRKYMYIIIYSFFLNLMISNYKFAINIVST